jgi:hypothetical protein
MSPKTPGYVDHDDALIASNQEDKFEQLGALIVQQILRSPIINVSLGGYEFPCTHSTETASYRPK